MRTIRLEPTGLMLGATGLSTAYDDSYPPELEGLLSEEEWLRDMERINSALLTRFPCVTCRVQAYLCCPCTLGLSLLSVRAQAREIEQGTKEVINNVNDNLKARGRDVRFDLVRKCCRAWVQVNYGMESSCSPSSEQILRRQQVAKYHASTEPIDGEKSVGAEADAGLGN